MAFAKRHGIQLLLRMQGQPILCTDCPTTGSCLLCLLLINIDSNLPLDIRD